MCPLSEEIFRLPMPELVDGRIRESPSLYLHLSGLVTRSASAATSMPTIMGAGIVPFVWLQAIHGVAPGSKRTAAIAPSSSAPRLTPSRRPRPAARLLPDDVLQPLATRRGTRQMPAKTWTAT